MTGHNFKLIVQKCLSFYPEKVFKIALTQPAQNKQDIPV